MFFVFGLCFYFLDQAVYCILYPMAMFWCGYFPISLLCYKAKMDLKYICSRDMIEDKTFRKDH